MIRELSDPIVLAIIISQLVASMALYYLFPALVLHWSDEFGWSIPQIMGAFSLALAVQGLSLKPAGTLIDQGLVAVGKYAGAFLGCIGLALMTVLTHLWQFYAIWALLGVAMGFTLYDAVFSLLIRCRGEAASSSISVITMITGLASAGAYTLVGWTSDDFGWRAILLILSGGMLCLYLPLIIFAVRRLESTVVPRRQEPHKNEPEGS